MLAVLLYTQYETSPRPVMRRNPLIERQDYIIRMTVSQGGLDDLKPTWLDRMAMLMLLSETESTLAQQEL